MHRHIHVLVQTTIRRTLAVQLVIAKLHKYSVLHCCTSTADFRFNECSYSNLVAPVTIEAGASVTVLVTTPMNWLTFRRQLLLDGSFIAYEPV